MRVLLFLSILLSLSAPVFSQKTPLDPRTLALQWEVVENNHQNKTQTLSALTLTNRGKTALPATGWSLYFNYVRAIQPASVTGGVKIDLLNGDLFRLTPTAGFSGLKPGASTRIEFVSNDWVVNITDAPAGFYLVWDNAPQTGIPLTSFTVKPSTEPRQYLRFAGDKTGLVTPQQVYAQNRANKDRPASDLPPIFPTPLTYRAGSGTYTLTPAADITTDPAFAPEAEYLAGELAVVLGKKPTVKPGTGAASAGIMLVKGESGLEGDESYRLSVTPQGITVSASTGKGIFYGIQSIKSLLPPAVWSAPAASVAVPAVEVTDAPRFGWRAVMLDVARNFHSKTQVIKLLDLMSLYKLNVLHLHFSDDEGWRVEIPSLPELTAVGSVRAHSTKKNETLPPSYGSGPTATDASGSGHYSKADFIEILRYATARHIQVVPEIETPGHARAAIKAMDARYERLLADGKRADAERYLLRDLADKSVYRSVQSWDDNVINVALPSVYRFLETVVDDLVGMYREAAAPLGTIHMGGDEVPAGVWAGSPACQAIFKTNPSVKGPDDLWYYYYGKVSELLHKRGLALYGWEEIAMRKTSLDGKAVTVPNADFLNAGTQVDVWNNVLGWGAEDLAYKLANAGYKVVLSNVTNLYFDMAYQKDYDEPGYYWGAYTDVDKAFYFIPYDYFKNAKEDRLGNPLDRSIFNGKERLTDYGKSNIVGIQGLLWSETVRGPERMEYMMLPKLLGLAERAWTKDPDWATEKDPARSEALYADAWSTFVNTLGKRELPRLDGYAGGFNYRIPTAGATVENGTVTANAQFPGLTIRYTTDGTEPTLKSKAYTGPIRDKGTISLRVFNSKGRGGRTVTVGNQ